MINIRQSIKSKISRSIKTLLPGINEDLSVISETQKNWHYSTPSAIQIYNKHLRVNFQIFEIFLYY